MYNYAPRLSLSYADLSGVIAAFAETCDSIVVYEHEADAQVKKTHIHLLILGSKVKDEALRRLAQKKRSDIRMSGNSFWKWAIKEEHKPKFESDPLTMITYMSKGHLAYKYCKNISPDIIDSYRTKWVSHVDSATVPALKYDEYEALKSDLCKESHYWMMTLDRIRTWTMAWYWKRDGRLPNAGQYKRNAASLYLVAQSYNNGHLGNAFEELKNLWY